jgi:SAM-dependent methyltransferase
VQARTNRTVDLPVRLPALRARYRAALRATLGRLVPPGSRVLDLGCGDGELLAALRPAHGVGLDLSPAAIARAQRLHPEPTLRFAVGDVALLEPPADGPFDFVLLVNLVGELTDVQGALERVRACCTPATRVVIVTKNYLWQPLVALAELLGLKVAQEPQNWLTPGQLQRLGELAGLEPLLAGGRGLVPLPGGERLDRVLTLLPGLEHLCWIEHLVLRPSPAGPAREPSVTVVVPCKDERGNVAETIRSVPKLGSYTELLFVDGHSTDGTVEEIRRHQGDNPQLDRVRVLVQPGRGKADAVRLGFDEARGEILLILDSDNTVRGEDLPKFYALLASGRAEFVNGSRLVYPMEDQAMRQLNLVANHLFGRTFSWLLGQPLTDTLCGTKGLYRRDWLRIREQRQEFGEDPFGDFDLLFGAAKNLLKIQEIPVRYRRRAYGEIKIQRFRNGLQLLRMAARGWRIFKG